MGRFRRRQDSSSDRIATTLDTETRYPHTASSRAQCDRTHGVLRQIVGQLHPGVVETAPQFHPHI